MIVTINTGHHDLGEGVEPYLLLLKPFVSRVCDADDIVSLFCVFHCPMSPPIPVVPFSSKPPDLGRGPSNECTRNERFAQSHAEQNKTKGSMISETHILR